MTRSARSDKERNRERLLDAAARALQREGVGVSMRAIAREAGMGIATAYRHFPTKNELVEAVLATQVDLCSRAMRSALAEPDPWEGLRSVIDVRVGMLAMTAFSGGQGPSSATAVQALRTILVHGISGPA